MQIFVRGSEETRVLAVDEATPVAEVLASMGAGVLSVGGRPLTEGSLAEAGVRDLATLDFSARLLGGKVHGSLARAGKVKGQTPKVEAQEKKKKKTGRAKRRIQYNRRFVNVVTQPGGRKKGPNSNSA